MARTILDRLVSNLAFYSFGIFSFFLYLVLSLRSGEFFRKFSEKDRLQYDIGTADPMLNFDAGRLTPLISTRPALEPSQITHTWLLPLLPHTTQWPQTTLHCKQAATRAVRQPCHLHARVPRQLYDVEICPARACYTCSRSHNRLC